MSNKVMAYRFDFIMETLTTVNVSFFEKRLHKLQYGYMRTLLYRKNIRARLEFAL